jgi:hypothetical protein
LRYPDHPVVEDGGRLRDVDLAGADELARVRHGGVERHDVQVVGVAGQDVPDQVSGAGIRQFRVDRGLAVEGGITRRQGLGP